MGKDIEDAVAKVKDMLAVIGDEILSGYDWRTRRAATGPKAYWNAVIGAVDYLRDPATPGNQVEEGEPNLAERFRRAAGPARPDVRDLPGAAATSRTSATTSRSSRKSGC